jgi:hypothetical protein
VLVAFAFASGIAFGGCSSDPASDPPTIPTTGADGAIGDDASVTNDGGGDAAEEVDAGPPAIRFIGRFDTRDPAGPKCAWPGCRIIANFEGTQVSADMTEIVQSWMDGAPSEWDVIVDDVEQPKIVMTPPNRSTFVLATGLAAGKHRVELYKRSETQNGVTQFHAFDFGAGTLLPPPLRASRRIEIVGDSQPAAYGVEGTEPCANPGHWARYQSFRKSFGALLGVRFGAEVHGTVYSGKGMTQNIWRPDTDTMPIVFGRVDPLDPAAPFALATWIPDVVVIMLGGNDFSLGQPADNGAPSETQFTNAYRDFVVGVLRSSYPNAHLFLTLSPSVRDVDRNARTIITSAITTIASERAAASDLRVHAFVPTESLPIGQTTELDGCDGHGTPAFHQRVAGELAAQITTKVAGWL